MRYKKEISHLMKICKFIESKKAEDVQLFNLKERNFIFEYSIAATCLNKRHLHSMSGDIEEFLGTQSIAVHHIEGNENSGWMIIDCFDFVINLFTREERERLSYDTLFDDPKREIKA